MDKQPDALKIIDHWIRTATDPHKKMTLFVIQDMIHGDLKYIHASDTVEIVKTFLDAGNQDNEDLKAIREFIKL